MVTYYICKKGLSIESPFEDVDIKKQPRIARQQEVVDAQIIKRLL